MIFKNDTFRFDLEFNVDRFAMHATEILQERADDLKALVAKRCQELAKELDVGWLEKQVQQKVDALWQQELHRFIQSEAQSRVYEEMDKVRETIAKRSTPRRSRR